MLSRILSNFPATELGGAVFADVEGANVVGYNTQTLNDGLTGSVAAFQGVNNSENLPISALTPVSASLVSEAISIQTLDTFGVMAKTYLYITDKDYGDYGLETPGWIDMDQYGEGVLADKEFEPGEGYLAVNSLADGKLTSAGEVAKGATLVPLKDGLTTMGNILPTTMDVQALVPVSESLVSEAVSIQTLDNFGVMAKTYLYITEKDYGDYGLETPGWIDMDQYGEGVLAEKVFDPSEGFLAVNSLADAQLKFPAVIPAE